LIYRRTIGERSELVVDTMAAAEVAAIGFWYRRGSRDETAPGGAAPPGSTHFIEHLLFKGTQLRTAYGIAREIDRIGGSLNAFTEREAVVLTALVPAEGFEAAVAVLADMTGASRFEPDETERERAVIINELAAAAEDPEEAAADAFYEELWPGHPLGRRIGGSVADIEALSAADLAGHYRRNYRGAPALVSVAGGVDADRAAGALAAAFRGMDPAPDAPDVRRPPETAGGPRIAFRPAAAQNIQLFYGAFTPRPAGPEEYYAAQLANAAIGEAMSSRLFQELRERLGLCYTVGSGVASFSDSFLWNAYAATTVEDAAALADTLIKEIRRALAGGLRPEEIADAKSHLIGAFKLAAGDYEYRMRRIGRHLLLGLEPFEVGRSIAWLADAGIDAVGAALADRIGAPPFLFAYGDKRVGPRVRRACAAALEAAL
jgi:predicted Zn-dependent peptidase